MCGVDRGEVNSELLLFLPFASKFDILIIGARLNKLLTRSYNVHACFSLVLETVDSRWSIEKELRNVLVGADKEGPAQRYDR